MKYFIYLFLAISFYSCDKIGQTTVKGKVIDLATGQPLPNILVYVSEARTFRSSSTPDQDYTDENGEFKVRIWYQLLPSYNCIAATGNEFMPDDPERGVVSRYNMHRGRQEVTFKLCYKAYLKWDLVNLNCQPTDTFKLWVNNAMGGYPYSNAIILTGCDSFQSLHYVDVPYHQWNLHWQVIENGITTDYYDTFYLNPAEEKTYSILY